MYLQENIYSPSYFSFQFVFLIGGGGGGGDSKSYQDILGTVEHGKPYGQTIRCKLIKGGAGQIKISRVTSCIAGEMDARQGSCYQLPQEGERGGGKIYLAVYIMNIEQCPHCYKI